jgi:hypothetical protein
MSTSTSTRIADGVTTTYLRDLIRDSARTTEPEPGRATSPGDASRMRGRRRPGPSVTVGAMAK